MNVISNEFTFNPKAEIPFLSKQFMREANTVLRLSDEILEEFYNALALIEDNAALRQMAWECHYILYATVTNDQESGRANDLENLHNRKKIWPERSLLDSLMGEQAGMFAAIVLISGLPKTIEWYESRGIPLAVLLNTMSDVEVWMRDYRNKHGAWGLENIRWLEHHMSGRLFRLGRLQFISDPLGYPIHVFRHTVSGKILAFPADGIRYRRDGQADGNNGIHEQGEGWTSRFAVTEQEIIGNPLPGTGYALPTTVHLPRADWHSVLAVGDSVLHVHIAEGSKMTHELCRESYREALEFYPQYFPEMRFTAFACGSWLLSPQFQQLLPDTSNIVRFQQDYFLFPILSHDEETYSRVFGMPCIDPATALRDTTLRRAIVDYVVQGNRMIGGAGFILKEDVENGTFQQGGK